MACVAYKYSSDTWQEILIALLVLWPAADCARIVLLEWIRKEPIPVFEHRRAGFFPAASIFVGVILFGVGGLLLARTQQADLERKWMDDFVNYPPNWMNPPADDGGVQAAQEQEPAGCL